MTKISPIEIRTLSMLGQRGTFGKVLADLGSENPNIIAMTADQSAGAGLNRFKERFPDRFYNMGISEQNAVGVAAGLADEGFIPFLAFQAVFASTRCTDQVRVCMSYMSENVKLIGIFAGVTQGDCGPTHYAVQDIAIMRSMPNMVVLSPADTLETLKMIELVTKINAPVYIRLSGAINTPIIYKEDYKLEIGKAITVKEGTDITIIATGTMIHNVLKSAKILEEKGISAKVVNMHTLKPLDNEAIEEACASDFIVSVEEHSKIGGLGSAIAESLSIKKHRPPHLILGISDEYKYAGDYKAMIEQYNLTPEKIAENIIEKYKGEN